MKDSSQSVFSSEIEQCRNTYEEYYDKLLNSGYSDAATVDACAHYYLDGKPYTKGLTPLNRSIAFWNCHFWQNIPSDCYETDSVAFALGRAIHFGVSDIVSIEKIIQTAPDLLKRGLRYSKAFLNSGSPLWSEIRKLSCNSSEDFRDFIRACDRIREMLKTHDESIEKLQSQLVELTVFEFLLYGSLFAFHNIVPARFNASETGLQSTDIEQEISGALNQLLVWKLKTRPENDFRLNERFLGNSLKRHLMPLIFPENKSSSMSHKNMDLFMSLIKAKVDHDNFYNQTIMAFCFDDDYRYSFDGDHLTLYPIEIPEESDWDRNGRKFSALHSYWFNRAVIGFAQSDLRDQSFGLPENDEGNRLAYIKACQVYLQLDEIFGMNPEVELPNNVRMNLFKALHSLELMTAFFNSHHIAPFKTYYQTSGNWINALSQLMMEGIAEGENRFPLTWAEPADKAQRIKAWTVSDSHPEGDIKAAEAILSFWTNDLYSLAINQKTKPNIPVPEFHERPILKLGCYGFQLPWLMSNQNNSTAAINNLRRIGSRRGDRKNETHRIEQRLGELFESKGFTVVHAYQPKKTIDEDPGEIDLICFLEGHLFLMEIKSTYIRKTSQDAWIHRTTTLRRAAQQLKRKRKAVLSALGDDEALRSNLRIYDQETNPAIHTWIVDTSIEYDQATIDGFLKISLEGLIVILRNEQYLLRGLLFENEDIPNTDLFPEGFSAKHFAEIVEEGQLWSVLDE